MKKIKSIMFVIVVCGFLFSCTEVEALDESTIFSTNGDEADDPAEPDDDDKFFIYNKTDNQTINNETVDLLVVKDID